MAIAFEPLSYWWLAAVAAALAAAAAAYGALRLRGLVAARSWVLFLLLRLGAVAAVILYVLGPAVEFRGAARVGPPVAVLVDSSASMDFAAGGQPRLAGALAVARGVAAAVQANGGSYRFYDFAAARRPWGEYVPDEAAVKEGPRARTDAGGALAELAARFGPDGLAAVVVLSDGAWDAPPASEGLPPCLTMAVGVEPPPGRVFITGVDAPATVTAGTSFDVRVRYFSTLGAGDTAAVSVAEGETAERTYRLAVGPGRGEVHAKVKATGPGDRFYRLRVAPGAGERWFHTRVLARPLRIWYWEMAGDADFAFLRRALATNADFDFGYRLDVGDRSISSGRPAPAESDIVVVGNPRAAKLTGAAGDALERVVAAGGGLLFVITARPVDLAALTSGALGRLLPVRDVTQAKEVPGGPLTATSLPGAVTVGAAAPRASHVWRLGVLKEGATPAWQAPDGTPALVFMPYGLGRVALLSAGGLFKWQLRGGDDEAELAAALVLSLYQEGARALAVSRRIVAPGETVEVTCRAAAEPTASLAGPGGNVRPLALTNVGADLWAGDAELPRTGRYEVTARLPTPSGVDVEKAAIMATPSAAEYAAFRARPAPLRALAAATGGRYFDEGDGAALAAAAADIVRAAPRERTRTRRRLWPAWLAFPAALLFLLGEWILRRRAGLR